MTLDPRWDWAEVTDGTGRTIQHVKLACRHRDVTPVIGTDDETKAHLCLTCDAQLPAEWQP